MSLDSQLRQMGFLWDGTSVHDAVVRFQLAYCGPPTGHNTKGWLEPDGIAGPMTQDSINWVLNNAGKLSTNYHYSDTWCHHCRQNFVRRELLSALEALCGASGHRVAILDMCRCPSHNKAIGGASDSQHQYGTGADPAPTVNANTVIHTGRFSGLGSRDGFRTLCHVDVRHIFGPALNHTNSTVANPARFVE